MSYILDALKRADAERERGSVPGLHTQPAAVADGDPAARGLKPWMWMALGVSLALAGTLAWRLLSGDEAPREIAVAPASPAATPPAPPPMATQAPVAAVQPAPAPGLATPATPPAAPTPLAPQTHPAPAPRANGTPPQAMAAPHAAAPAPMPAPMPAPAPVPSTTAVAPAARPTPEARIYARGELPEEIRRELPALAIGGSIYSENPASRFLIINGQVLHEGDKVNADLSLEQIKLKAAVLKYKGYRYEITY